jgi:hypothetical protein
MRVASNPKVEYTLESGDSVGSQLTAEWMDTPRWYSRGWCFVGAVTPIAMHDINKIAKFGLLY